MGSNKTFYIVFVSAVVLLVGAIAFFFLQSPLLGQTNDVREISNGDVLEHGTPPQISNGEESAVTESSSINDERESEGTTKIIVANEYASAREGFELYISVWGTTLPRAVNFGLRNTSGEDYVISDLRIILPHGLEPQSFRVPISSLPCGQIAFPANDRIFLSDFFRNELELGTHELQFRAEFLLLDSESGMWERVYVLSNTVELSGVESAANADDFVLTISVAEATLPQGQNFRVFAELKNISGEGYEIEYDFLFWPWVEGWVQSVAISSSRPPSETRILEANSAIRNIEMSRWSDYERGWLIGGGLEPGTHELRFSAMFWLRDREQQVEILSEPILLTVTEATTTAEDFVLTVTVEETTLPRGEDFRVIVELKNNSGEDQEITYGLLFMPQIPGWLPWEVAVDPLYPETIFFEANGILRNTEIRAEFWGVDERGWRIGGNLVPGAYYLRVSVAFSLRDHDLPIQFLSDPVVLTVR